MLNNVEKDAIMKFMGKLLKCSFQFSNYRILKKKKEGKKSNYKI